MRGELVPARRRTRSSRPRARFGVSSSGARVRDARVLVVAAWFAVSSDARVLCLRGAGRWHRWERRHA